LPGLPNIKKLSFSSWWSGEATALTEVIDIGVRAFIFGYTVDSGEDSVNRVVAAFENDATFALEARSTLWRAAEISAESQPGWLMFFRIQDDISLAAQRDFFVDSKNFLEYLRDEDIRLNRKVTASS